MTTPSLAMIPTGFKAGKLYSVLPEPIYGSELVTNGDFATDTDWTKGTGWTISGGSANCDGTSGLLNQNIPTLIAGKMYKWTFEITSYTSGSVKFYSGSGSDDAIYKSSVGTFTQYFIAESNLKYVYSNSFNGSIDNLSVKEVRVGDGDFDVTRATTATRINEQGLIESMANNVPRLDYTDGGCPVLLTEPQSTNIITYSEDFSNGSYAKSRIVVTSNNTTSPDGTINADKIIATAVSGTHFSTLSPTVTSGIPYTLSLFVKSAEYDWVTIMMQGAGWVGSSKSISFNSTTGVFGTVSAGITYSSKSLTNGWYKLSITNTTAATSANVRIYPTPSDSELSYTGDGTSGVYMYGAQAEALPYATSYIPTNGSTVTRVKDVVNNAGDVNTFNSEEGVLFVELGTLTNTPSSDLKLGISDGTNNNRIQIWFKTTTNQIRLVIISDTGVSVLLTYTLTDTKLLNKFAIVWSLGVQQLWVNGSIVLSDTDNFTFNTNTLNTLDLTDTNGTNPFFGKTKQLKVYKSIAEAQIDLPYIT